MPEEPTSKQRPPFSEAFKTGWEKLDSMADEEIDTSDIPEPTPEQFARAVLREGLRRVTRKQQVTLRVDADVLNWFRAQGKGYQSRINTLLRAYKDAHESENG